MHTNSFLKHIRERGKQPAHTYSFLIDTATHSYVFLVMHTFTPFFCITFCFLGVSDPTGSHGLPLGLTQPLNLNLAYRHSDGYRLTIPWPTVNMDGYRLWPTALWTVTTNLTHVPTGHVTAHMRALFPEEG